MAKVTKASSAMSSIGVAGLKVSTGYVWEEYLTNLRGQQGIKIFQTMLDSDTTVGAVLQALQLPIQRASWNVEPALVNGEAQVQAKVYADFARSLMDDLNQDWTSFLSEALSMLPFGWAYHEVTYKRRLMKSGSRFDDGLIGVQSMALRAQDTLQRWEMDETNSDILGMWQLPPTGGKTVLIPMEKALLFRTRDYKNNPEGRSILRTAYRAWWNKKTAEDYEIIGIERELAGLPVVRIPSRILTSTDPADTAIKTAYEKIAMDIKFNQQGGIVIPSDPFISKDGTPSSIPQVDIELLSSGGKRAIDTNQIINRYDQQIARSALAGFLTLGSNERGSYSLSKSFTDLFLASAEYYLWRIAGPLNRSLMPKVWKLNGFPPEMMPKFQPGKIAPADLNELSTFIGALAATGMPLFPDPTLEAHMRETAGLPAAGASEEV